MKKTFYLTTIGFAVIFFTSCFQKTKWEYKVTYFEAEKIASNDKNYSKSNDIFKSTVSSTSVIPAESSLNQMGIEGWEIATSYLEQETVFPNLLASGNGVDGLQSNTRPQRLVVIYKRQMK